jgi:hypothetical protein
VKGAFDVGNFAMAWSAFRVVRSVATAAPAHAQPPDLPALPGLVVDETAVALDPLGQPVVDTIPGARQREPLPPDVNARLLELSEQRDEVGATSAVGPVPERVAPLAGEESAPSRVDSADPDPDRLRERRAQPGNQRGG